MALITFDTLEKDTRIQATLDISEVVSISKVGDSSQFAVPSAWAYVVVKYNNPNSNQLKQISFDVSNVSDFATTSLSFSEFYIGDQAAIASVLIVDKEGGTLLLSRRDIPDVEDLDISFTGVSLFVMTQVSNTRDGGNDAPSLLTVVGNFLYFRSTINASDHRKLFRINTTTLNVEQVSNTNPSGSDGPSLLTVVGNSLYFRSTIANLSKLFRINNNETAPVQVSNTRNGGDDFPTLLTVAGDFLYFSSIINASGHNKLFRINTTTLDVEQVSNTRDGGNDGPASLTVVGNFLYFSSIINASNHRKLFRINTTTLDVEQVSNTNDGGNDNPTLLTVIENSLYFSSIINASNHNKLFRYGPEI